MTTITLGRWQVAALAAGVAVLTVVALLLGAVMAALILTGGGDSPMASASAPATASAATTTAAPAAGGGLGATARSNIADSFEARQGVIETADIFSDEARGRAISATEPVTRGAADAARRFLPGWMAGTAAHVIEKTGYRVTEFAGNSVEGVVEDTLNDRLDAMKEDGGGSGPAPVRHYAIELGRFATPSNAESFAAAAAQRGVRGTVDFAPLPGGNAPYAVRTGRYAAADEAARALDALTRANGVSGTVVTLAEAGER
ncbi:SPOR domain-containing protein [Azospirillum sp. YIM DDC1]|uniref:SPOR domain-containing protein n=1 Tax=Azospirillum aestuarii TaxID=2802052 RepID=A0ABS1I695_9PROT|nr:SPOR domain-containing protein [Azospirillum aestuarii]MBK4722434.1 SPOR domain-containing protein [Azospirillum aestuarii]